MKNLVVLINLTALVLSFGCQKLGDSTPTEIVQVSFTSSKDEVLVNEAVQFTNTSKGAGNATYLWDFGDGSTSMDENPVHVFTTIGKYVVVLKVSGENKEDSFSQQITVRFSNTINGRLALLEQLAQHDEIMVCAHRGYHRNVPENSISSVEQAIEQGIEMVELDIRTTRDNQLVLMHDSRIDRTTTGTGKVEDLTLAEIKQFQLLKSTGEPSEEKVPTLAEVLSLTCGKLYIDLDLKGATFSKVFSVVNLHGMTRQCLFYMTSATEVFQAVDRSADVLAMPRIKEQADLDLFQTVSELKVVQYNGNDESILSEISTEDWHLFRNAYVNSTVSPLVDDHEMVRQAQALGAKIIQTDFPDEVILFLENN